jgi:hypothetical protein
MSVEYLIQAEDVLGHEKDGSDRRHLAGGGEDFGVRAHLDRGDQRELGCSDEHSWIQLAARQASACNANRPAGRSPWPPLASVERDGNDQHCSRRRRESRLCLRCRACGTRRVRLHVDLP